MTQTIFRHQFVIPESAVDQNGHVNNVVYVQWMQDAAIRHSESNGGTMAAEAAGGTWVVRSHAIEYLSPAFAGEEVVAITWVVNFRRVRSLRRYRFVRLNDEKLLARGETEWVFIDSLSSRPRVIPDEVLAAFPLPEAEEIPT